MAENQLLSPDQLKLTHTLVETPLFVTVGIVSVEFSGQLIDPSIVGHVFLESATPVEQIWP